MSATPKKKPEKKKEKWGENGERGKASLVVPKREQRREKNGAEGMPSHFLLLLL